MPDNKPQYIDKIYGALNHAYGKNGVVASGTFDKDLDTFKNTFQSDSNYVDKIYGALNNAYGPQGKVSKGTFMHSPEDFRKQIYGTNPAPSTLPRSVMDPAVPVINAGFMLDYENSQKAYKDAFNQKVQYDDRKKFATTGGSMFGMAKAAGAEIGGGLSQESAIKSTLNSTKAKATAARLKFDAEADKLINEEIKKYGVNAFMEMTDDRLVGNPTYINTWANNIAKKSGAAEGGYAATYLKTKMTAFVNSYEIYNKSKKAADAEFKKKHGSTFDEMMSAKAKDIDLKARAVQVDFETYDKTLRSQLDLEMASESKNAGLALKQKAEGIVSYREQFFKDFDQKANEINVAFQSGLKNEQEANAEIEQLNKSMKEFQNQYKSEIQNLFAEEKSMSIGLSSKFNSRYKRQMEEYESVANAKLRELQNQAKSTGISDDLYKEYLAILGKQSEIVKKQNEYRVLAKNNAFMHEADIISLYGTLPNFLKGAYVSLGNTIATYSSAIGFDAGVLWGEEMATQFEVPHYELKKWSDYLANPAMAAGLAGQTIGGMAPMIAAQAALGLATGGASVYAQLAMQGALGLTLETMQMSQDMYNSVFSETGDIVAADGASRKVIDDQMQIAYLYALDGLPFIDKIAMGIKGKSFLSYAGRAIAKAGVETATEIPQEFLQSGGEARTREQYVKNRDGVEVPIMKFIDIYNNKEYTDAYGNKTTPRAALENTVLNILPSTIIMGGAPEMGGYARKKTSEVQGARYWLKNSLSSVSPAFHSQYVNQIFLDRGENFAAGYIEQAHRSGMLSDDQYESLVSGFQSMKDTKAMLSSGKIDKKQATAIAAMQMEVNAAQQAFDSSADGVEKTVAQKSLDLAKANLGNFLAGKPADVVEVSIGKDSFIATYDQYRKILQNQDFIENAHAGGIKIVVHGSQSQELSELTKSRLTFMQPINTKEVAEPGTPEAVFADTEIPHLNQLIDQVEAKMNEAEDVPMSAINEVVEKLYSQAEAIMSTHFDSDGGKQALKIIFDKIDQIKNYEFATDKETQVVTETATIQTARAAVEYESGIAQRAAGRGKNNTRSSAKVTLEDGSTGSYAFSVSQGGIVSLDPESGSPIILGPASEVNRSARLEGEPVFDKNGLPRSIKFTIQGVGVERGRKTIEMSTNMGHSQDAMMDMLIDMRAQQIGTVDPKNFDEAFNTVSQTTKEVDVYPNMPVDVEAGPTTSTQQPTQEVAAEATTTTKPPTAAVPQRNEWQNKTAAAIENANKSLVSIGTSYTVSPIETEEEFKNLVEKAGEKYDGQLGVVVNGKAYVNMSKIDSNEGVVTAFHEAFHGMWPGLPKNIKDKFNKIIRDISFDGGKVTAKSLKAFADQYDVSERNEELFVEFMAYLAAGGKIEKTILDKLIILLNKLFKNFGFEISSIEELMNFAEGMADAVSKGEKLDISVSEEVSGVKKRSSVAIVKSNNAAKRLGLKGKYNNVRNIAEALELNQRQKHGIIDKEDRSKESLKKIAKWMASEVEFFLNLKGENSGIGWYGEKFQKALDNMSEIFPELKTDKSARALFTMLVAVTSDGEKVMSNFRLASIAYESYRKNGTFPVLKAQRQESINGQIQKIAKLLEEYNGDAEKLSNDLLEKSSISDLNKKRSKEGLPNLTTEWPAGFNAPLSASVFSPKLGMFFANLSGQQDYPTLDRWWSRTFNRYRGTLIPSIGRGLTTKGEAIGIDRVKKLAGDPNMTDDAVLEVINQNAASYKDKGYKNGTELEKASNTLFKVLNINIIDAPYGKNDRKFMYDAFIETKKSLGRKGIDVSIADIQAILWYYEKFLYKHLGAKGKIEGISYENAASSMVDKYKSNGNSFDFTIKASEDADSIEASEDEEMRTEDVDETTPVKFRKHPSTKPVLISNAPDGHFINVGLQVGNTDETIPTEDITSKLPSGINIIEQAVVQGTEPTLAIQMDRALTEDEMGQLLDDTKQFAIPMLSNKMGTMNGTLDWGPFNPDYFVMPDGKKLSSVKFRKAPASKLDNTYADTNMTRDEDGNFVFFHVSNNPEKSLMKGVDSRKHYTTHTSRDEKGLQYGVASFYTKPTDGERMVGGQKYYVTVSPDKVYHLDIDPNGYYEKADAKIKPNAPFRTQAVQAEIASMAKKDGFEMMVADWGILTERDIPNQRADALVVLKPKKYTGEENFKTGEEMGVNVEHPMKEALEIRKQSESLAEKVSSFKGKKGQYDESYQLAESIRVFGGGDVYERDEDGNESIRPLTKKDIEILTRGTNKSIREEGEKLSEKIKFRKRPAPSPSQKRHVFSYASRVLGFLPGSGYDSLRTKIYDSPLSYYTPEKYSEIKDDLKNMTDQEILDNIAFDDPQKLFDLFMSSNSNMGGLAFSEYIYRMNERIAAAKSAGLIQEAQMLEDQVQASYALATKFVGKAGQILRQFGAMKKMKSIDDIVEHYLNIAKAFIEEKGRIVSPESEAELKKTIKNIVEYKQLYADLYKKIATDPNATAQDKSDMYQMAIAEMSYTTLFAAQMKQLAPPSWWEMISGWIRGNLISIRSAVQGLMSNFITYPTTVLRDTAMGALGDVIAATKKVFPNLETFGLENHGFFNSMKFNDAITKGYGGIIRMLYDAVYGLTVGAYKALKKMAGGRNVKEYTSRSLFAKQMMHTLKYGPTNQEDNALSELFNASQNPAWAIKRGYTRDGKNIDITVDGIKSEMRRSFKKKDFMSWVKSTYPSIDYTTLSGSKKKELQNEYSKDPVSSIVATSDRVKDFAIGAMSFNSEFNYRMVAMSDYIPKRYAGRVMMGQLAAKLGLNETQTELFILNPEKYIETVSTNLSPEVLKYYQDQLKEITATKETGTGIASSFIVDGIKNLPRSASKRITGGVTGKADAASQFLGTVIDSILPFVKIPMNYVSMVMDYAIPAKSFLKSGYHLLSAIDNAGTAKAESHALSSMKYLVTGSIGVALNHMAYTLISIPLMVTIGSPKSDDEEDKRFLYAIPRNSINASAFKRLLTGEDPTYQSGDKYQSLNAFGLLGLILYTNSAASERAEDKLNQKLKNLPANVDPKSVSGYDDLMSMKNESLTGITDLAPYFIEQSWFMGLSSGIEALKGDEGADKFFTNWINSLASISWIFSGHAQQLSDIYREATGKPLMDARMTGELKNVPYEESDILSRRIKASIMNRNELVHQLLIDNPIDQEYMKFAPYGKPVTAVIGENQSFMDMPTSIMLPTREAETNLSNQERWYLAVIKSRENINIPGYDVNLMEPMVEKIYQAELPRPMGEGSKQISMMMPAGAYNKINQMAGAVLEDIHGKLMEPYDNIYVKGRKVGPDDIMSDKFGRDPQIIKVKKAMAVAISEGNKIVKSFSQPWTLFKDDELMAVLEKDNAQIIAIAISRAQSSINMYQKFDHETGKFSQVPGVLSDENISNQLSNLARKSINTYIEQLRKAKKIEAMGDMDDINTQEITPGLREDWANRDYVK